MGLISTHQRLMRNGYLIPFSCEWFTYPLGVERTLTLQQEVGGEMQEVEIPNPALEPMRLERRLKIVEHDKFMETMRKLRAVR